MPLNLEKCTASHCTEFTGAVNLYKKKLSLRAFVWSWRREHIVCLFSGRSHQDWSHLGLLYSRQLDRLPKVAGMPFVEAAQYRFSRWWGKWFWPKQIICQSGTNAIDNFFCPSCFLPKSISPPTWIHDTVLKYSVMFSSGGHINFGKKIPS